MIKKLSIFFFLSTLAISILEISSCAKAKQGFSACVGTITNPATVGAPITFISCTSGATSYSWSFGDGSTAMGDSVLHTYTSAGTYSASLTVSNGSSTNTRSFTVKVVPNGWTFKGGSVSVDSAVAYQPTATLTAGGTTSAGNATLIVKFFPFPTLNGTYSYLIYNAQNGPTGSRQLFVLLNRDSDGIQNQYGSTGSDSIFATVGVSGGKISVSLPSIEMYNLNNYSDSSSLSATFTQTR